MIAPTPDKSLVRVYALTWIIGYLTVFFFFRDLLPQKSLSDALYIQELVRGVSQDSPSRGFEIMAKIFSFLPSNVTWFVVGFFNSYVLYLIIMQVRTFRSMIFLPLILLPFITLNLQAPNKETLLLAVTLLVSSIAKRVKSDAKFIASLAVIYCLYAMEVRDYYYLILMAFVFFVIVLKSPPLLRWFYVLPVLIVLLLMPEEGYRFLGDTRNEVNFIVDFGSVSEVRTYFLNPFPSDNVFHFLGNYGYAFGLLHFPFIKSLTVKEVLLFLNEIVYGYLMVIGLTKLSGTVRLLALLFAAHIGVLVIFEPDFGSYFRHFSSILFYLMPAFVYLENKRVVFLQNRQREFVARHKP